MIHRKSFYFMRHGATEWNLKGLLMGHTDIPLHEVGIQEAQAAIITNNDEITHVFYSPLQRALLTMQIVTKHMNCPKEELPGIREQHIGDWAGKPREAFIKKDHNTYNPPGGEMWTQFRERILQTINSGLSKSDCPLFIAHGGVFRALIDVLNVEHASLRNCELVKFVPCTDSDRWQVMKNAHKHFKS